MNSNQIDIPKGICFIQIHYTDLEHTKKSHLLIKKLISKYFTILEIFGVNRGIYCPINKTRNAVMGILK